MRPRIKKGQDISISFNKMKEYLTENKCYGTIVLIKDSNTALYKFLMMYRSSKTPPVEVGVEVSLVSKLVLRTFIGDNPCASIREFMDKCKWHLR